MLKEPDVNPWKTLNLQTGSDSPIASARANNTSSGGGNSKYLPDLDFNTSFGQGGIEILGNRTDSTPALKINAKARNSGGTDVWYALVTLFVDDWIIDLRSILVLYNSSTRNYNEVLVSFEWIPTAGTHNITVFIDAADSVNESNENNNVLNTTVYISKAPKNNDPNKGKDNNSANNSKKKDENKGLCRNFIIIPNVMLAGCIFYSVRRNRKLTE